MSEKYLQYRGIRSWYAAEVLTDTDEGMTFGTPFPIAGLASVSKSTEVSSSPVNYDNMEVDSNETTGKDELTFNSAAIPDDALAKITGQYYDKTSGLFVEGAREAKFFATGYITKKTDGTEMFVWRLKGKFNIPTSTHETEAEGSEGTGQEVKYTGVDTIHKFTVNGKTKPRRAVTVNTKINPIPEEDFFAEVQTPDTIDATV